MKGHIEVIQSSYIAAALKLKGHESTFRLRAHKDDVEYLFKATKRLRADLLMIQEDLDLLEYMDAHRSIKWAARKVLMDRKRSVPNANHGGESGSHSRQGKAPD